MLSGLSRLPALAAVGETAYLLPPAAGLAYIVASQIVGQPASTRARTRAVQPQAAQPETQPDADQPETQPAYSLNGHGGPK